MEEGIAMSKKVQTGWGIGEVCFDVFGRLDGSERLDYGRNLCEDSDSESPIDYAAWSVNDCCYGGNCDY